MKGFESPRDAFIISGSTVAGTLVGSLALGYATSAVRGASGTLLGMAQGGIAGAGLGILGGAVISTALLSHPETQGRIGLALVGGAVGGVAGMATGLLAGAYLGSAGGNLVGYAAGAVAGAATGFFVSRHFVE